jgi:hypothetical protein
MARSSPRKAASNSKDDEKSANDKMEEHLYTLVDPKKIRTTNAIRGLKPSRVAGLVRNMVELGYLQSEPVTLLASERGDWYELVDGNHRLVSVLKVLSLPADRRPRMPDDFKVLTHTRTRPRAHETGTRGCTHVRQPQHRFRPMCVRGTRRWSTCSSGHEVCTKHALHKSKKIQKIKEKKSADFFSLIF